MTKEDTTTTAIVAPAKAAPVIAGARGIEINTMDDLVRIAAMAAKSRIGGLSSPEQCAVAIQFGLELGLTPMKALQSVVVINGRASLMTDLALAIVRGSGVMQKGSLQIKETGNEEHGTWTITVSSQRTDKADTITRDFSMQKAKRAKLWGKAGPWSEYPDRMLYWRALAFHLRDSYGDVLAGIGFIEEQRDIPQRERGPERVVNPPGMVDPLLAKLTTLSEPTESPQTAPPSPTDVPITATEILPPAASSDPEPMNTKGFQPDTPPAPKKANNTKQSRRRRRTAIDQTTGEKAPNPTQKENDGPLFTFEIPDDKEPFS